MTVDELRAALADLPGELPVILQKDAEGNGYSPADEVDQCLYVEYSTWAGEAYMTREQLDAKIAQGIGGWGEEDAAPEDAVPAVLIAPVN
jgi:hypothetical protein